MGLMVIFFFLPRGGVAFHGLCWGRNSFLAGQSSWHV